MLSIVLSKTGISANEILIDLRNHLKNILYAGVADGSLIFDMNLDDKKQYIEESSNWNRIDLLYINQVLIDSAFHIKNSNSPFLLLETTALKLLEMENSVKIDDLISKIDRGSIHQEKNIKINPREVHEIKEKYSDSEPTVNRDTQNNTVDSVEAPVKPYDKKKIVDMVYEPEIHELSLNLIEDNWKEFLDKIQTDRPSISAILEDFKPLKFNSDTLIIHASNSNSYNENIIKKGIELLKEQVESISNKKLNIEIKEDPKFVNKKLSNDQVKTQEKNEKHDEVFNKVVDLFDGEILR